jgi:hypothetical protein
LEDSALSPLIRLQAKRDALESALAGAKAKLAVAPAPIKALEATLGPLQAALDARDAVQLVVEEALQALNEGLLKLRDLNNAAYDKLRIAAKAWRNAGGLVELRPKFRTVVLETPAVMAMRRHLPFGEGTLLLHGDRSGRASDILYAAADDTAGIDED